MSSGCLHLKNKTARSLFEVKKTDVITYKVISVSNWLTYTVFLLYNVIILTLPVYFVLQICE